jgi:hypothetical protein
MKVAVMFTIAPQLTYIAGVLGREWQLYIRERTHFTSTISSFLQAYASALMIISGDLRMNLTNGLYPSNPTGIAQR